MDVPGCLQYPVFAVVQKQHLLHGVHPTEILHALGQIVANDNVEPDAAGQERICRITSVRLKVE
jgi:hypothetical protein